MSTVDPTAPVIPEGHVGIEIDGQPLVVPKNSMIIQAADKAGIAIPRFCYHDKLSVAANCRMCLVEIEKMGKPAPACATPVGDGMKVFTRSEKALKSQRNVMEFLLINHPLDCPICDQGGECELQDVSMGYGRSVSRYVDRKRVVPDEDIGPLVATEMTRCIQCTRCIRFTAEIAGTYELGGMYRGENLQIGTYDGKPLTTELSGNVIDVCPVGALTNKVFQFKARPWELTAKSSLGYHDALGSNLFLHVRRGEVLRIVPRDNEEVNEQWLSDRDRYSHQGLYAGDRAGIPMIREGDDFRPATWDEALSLAADIMKSNASNLGMLVHPATTNEEGALLSKIASSVGTSNVDHRLSQLDLNDGAVAEVSGVPVADIAKAKAVVIVGSNLRSEVPLLLHRVRQAQRHGAKVYVVNPVDFEFSTPLAGRTITPTSRIAEALQDSILIDDVKALGNAVVIVGGVAENSAYASNIRAAAASFAASVGGSVVRIPQGANAVGLTRNGIVPTGNGLDARAMLEAKLPAYVVYGLEPGLDFADTFAANTALHDAKVVAFSQYACQSTRAIADVILPIGALPEIDGTLTNLDGMDQHTVAGSKLPNEARAGWKVLRVLGEKLGAEGFTYTDWNSMLDSIAGVESFERQVAKSSTANAVTDGALEVAASQGIYRSDATVRRAAALQDHPLNVPATVVLNPADANGLNDGDIVSVRTDRGHATLPVTVPPRVAQGVAWVETGHGATAPLACATRVSIERKEVAA